MYMVRSALGFMQSLADVACSSGVVDRGLWLRIAQQHLSCTWFGGVALLSVTTSRIFQKVLGMTFVMVLLCHSSASW